MSAKATRPEVKRRRRKGMCLDDRPVLEPNAAGIDVGAREMFVAVPPGRDENPVRVFATFTEDLEQLADWLSAVRCDHGGYGIDGGLLDSALRACSSSGESAHVW